MATPTESKLFRLSVELCDYLRETVQDGSPSETATVRLAIELLRHFGYDNAHHMLEDN